jgi:hypothetical protein
VTAQPTALRVLVADQRDELTAHCAEALAFVDACRPLVDALGRVCLELGPREYGIVRQLVRRFDIYEARHIPLSDEPMAAAA